MTRLVRYTPEHGELLVHQASDGGWNTADRPCLASLVGPDAFTILSDNTILACAGVFPHWPGLGEAWMITSPEGQKHPTTLVRAVRRILYHAVTTGGYHRIQAMAFPTSPSCRLLEWLGFTKEHTLPCAGPNREPLVLYAKVTPWH